MHPKPCTVVDFYAPTSPSQSEQTSHLCMPTVVIGWVKYERRNLRQYIGCTPNMFCLKSSQFLKMFSD